LKRSERGEKRGRKERESESELQKKEEDYDDDDDDDHRAKNTRRSALLLHPKLVFYVFVVVVE
jgi:hypothetical protein